MLSSSMLLLNLIPLIDVTFSTPTPGLRQQCNWKNGAGDRDRTGDIQLGKFSLRISSVCGIREVIENTGILNR